MLWENTEQNGSCHFTNAKLEEETDTASDLFDKYNRIKHWVIIIAVCHIVCLYVPHQLKLSLSSQKYSIHGRITDRIIFFIIFVNLHMQW